MSKLLLPGILQQQINLNVLSGDLFENMVALWPMTESNGSVMYDNYGSNNGTIYNALVNQSGKFGSAYYFDGSGDYVSVPGTGFVGGYSGFTACCWVKPNGSSGAQVFIGQPASESSHISPYFYFMLAGINFNGSTWAARALFTKSDGSTRVQKDVGGLNNDTWYFIGMRFTGTELYLRINGSDYAYGGFSSTTIYSSSNEVRIGVNGAYSEGLIGYSHQHAIWNADMGSNALDFIYNSGDGRPISEWNQYTAA